MCINGRLVLSSAGNVAFTRRAATILFRQCSGTVRFTELFAGSAAFFDVILGTPVVMTRREEMEKVKFQNAKLKCQNAEIQRTAVKRERTVERIDFNNSLRDSLPTRIERQQGLTHHHIMHANDLHPLFGQRAGRSHRGGRAVGPFVAD